MATLELKHYSRKVGINVHHLEWCTKYRYRMLRQDEYKKLAEDILQETAKRHKMIVRELGVMPEHIPPSVECPPSMSQSKALQLLKGNLSYQLFRANSHFRLRYPKGHFFSRGGGHMIKINILKNKLKLEEDIEAIIDSEVKPLGNGAMVIASKKYIGRKAYIIIRKDS